MTTIAKTIFIYAAACVGASAQTNWNQFEGAALSFRHPAGWRTQYDGEIPWFSWNGGELSVVVSSIGPNEDCMLVHNNRVSKYTASGAWQPDLWRKWVPFTKTGVKTRNCGDTMTTVLENKKGADVIVYTTMCSGSRFFEFMWQFPRTAVDIGLHDAVLNTVNVAGSIVGTWSSAQGQWTALLKLSPSGRADYSFYGKSRTGRYTHQNGRLIITWTEPTTVRDICDVALGGDRAQFKCAVSANGTFWRRRGL